MQRAHSKKSRDSGVFVIEDDELSSTYSQTSLFHLEELEDQHHNNNTQPSQAPAAAAQEAAADDDDEELSTFGDEGNLSSEFTLDIGETNTPPPGSKVLSSSQHRRRSASGSGTTESTLQGAAAKKSSPHKVVKSSPPPPTSNPSFSLSNAMQMRLALLENEDTSLPSKAAKDTADYVTPVKSAQPLPLAHDASVSLKKTQFSPSRKSVITESRILNDARNVAAFVQEASACGVAQHWRRVARRVMLMIRVLHVWQDQRLSPEDHRDTVPLLNTILTRLLASSPEVTEMQGENVLQRRNPTGVVCLSSTVLSFCALGGIEHTLAFSTQKHCECFINILQILLRHLERDAVAENTISATTSSVFAVWKHIVAAFCVVCQRERGAMALASLQHDDSAASSCGVKAGDVINACFAYSSTSCTSALPSILSIMRDVSRVDPLFFLDCPTTGPTWRRSVVTLCAGISTEVIDGGVCAGSDEVHRLVDVLAAIVEISSAFREFSVSGTASSTDVLWENLHDLLMVVVTLLLRLHGGKTPESTTAKQWMSSADASSVLPSIGKLGDVVLEQMRVHISGSLAEEYVCQWLHAAAILHALLEPCDTSSTTDVDSREPVSRMDSLFLNPFSSFYASDHTRLPMVKSSAHLHTKSTLPSLLPPTEVVVVPGNSGGLGWNGTNHDVAHTTLYHFSRVLQHLSPTSSSAAAALLSAFHKLSSTVSELLTAQSVMTLRKPVADALCAALTLAPAPEPGAPYTSMMAAASSLSLRHSILDAFQSSDVVTYLSLTKLLHRVHTVTWCTSSVLPNEAYVALQQLQRVSDVLKDVSGSGSSRVSRVEARGAAVMLAEILKRSAVVSAADSSDGVKWMALMRDVTRSGCGLFAELIYLCRGPPEVAEVALPLVSEIDGVDGIPPAVKYDRISPRDILCVAMAASSVAVKSAMLTVITRWLDVQPTACEDDEVQECLVSLMAQHVASTVYGAVDIRLPVSLAGSQLAASSPLRGSTTSAYIASHSLSTFTSQVWSLAELLVSKSSLHPRHLRRVVLMALSLRGSDASSKLCGARLLLATVTTKQWSECGFPSLWSLVAELMCYSYNYHAADEETKGGEPQEPAQWVAAFSVASLALADNDVFDRLVDDTHCADSLFLKLADSPSLPSTVLSEREVNIVRELWHHVLSTRAEKAATAGTLIAAQLDAETVNLKVVREKLESEVTSHEVTRLSLKQAKAAISEQEVALAEFRIEAAVSAEKSVFASLPGAPNVVAEETEGRLAVMQNAADELLSVVASWSTNWQTQSCAKSSLRDDALLLTLQEDIDRGATAVDYLNGLLALQHSNLNAVVRAVSRAVDTVEQATSSGFCCSAAGTHEGGIAADAGNSQQMGKTTNPNEDSCGSDPLTGACLLLQVGWLTAYASTVIEESREFSDLVQQGRRVASFVTCSAAEGTDAALPAAQRQVGDALDFFFSSRGSMMTWLAEDFASVFAEAASHAATLARSQASAFERRAQEMLLQKQDELRKLAREQTDAFQSRLADAAKHAASLDQRIVELEAALAKAQHDALDAQRSAADGSGLGEMYRKNTELLKSMHRAKLADMQKDVERAVQDCAVATSKLQQSEQLHLATIAALKSEMNDLQQRVKLAEANSVVSSHVSDVAVNNLRRHAEQLQGSLQAERSARLLSEQKHSTEIKSLQSQLEREGARHQQQLDALQKRHEEQLTRHQQDARKEAVALEVQERHLLQQRVTEMSAKAAVLEDTVRSLTQELSSSRQAGEAEVGALRRENRELDRLVKELRSTVDSLQTEKTTLKEKYTNESRSLAVVTETLEAERIERHLQVQKMKEDVTKLEVTVAELQRALDRSTNQLLKEESKNDLLVKKLVLLTTEDELMHKTRGLDAFVKPRSGNGQQPADKVGRRGVIMQHVSQNRFRDASRSVSPSPAGNSHNASQQSVGASASVDDEAFRKEREDAASLFAQYVEAQRQYFEAEQSHRTSKVDSLRKLSARPFSVQGVKSLRQQQQQPHRRVAWGAEQHEASHDSRIDVSSDTSLQWKQPFDVPVVRDGEVRYVPESDPHLSAFFRNRK